MARFPGGYSILLDLSSSWQRHMFAGCFERREYWLVKQVLRRGDLFIDGGANVGYYTFLAASVVAPGEVHAFEPEPSVAAQLLRSVEMNPLLNITVHQAAIAGRDGEGTLFVPPDQRWWAARLQSRLSRDPNHEWMRRTVRCVTLDRFLQSHGFGLVHLAKLDLEGEEPAALHGARNSLTEGVLESLVIEVPEESRDLFVDELKRYSFEFIVDLRSWRRLLQVDQLGVGKHNLFLARGACAKRYSELGWRRLFV